MPDQETNITLTASDDCLPPPSRQGFGLTICLVWNRILIHRKTIRALNTPQRVRLLINPNTRHFCVQGCDEKEACSFPVPREMAPVYDPLYIHSKFLLSQIYEMMAWPPNLSYRVFGKINTKTQVMDFDLNRYVLVHGDEHLENDEVPEELMQDDPLSSGAEDPISIRENAVITLEEPDFAPDEDMTKREDSVRPFPSQAPVPLMPEGASLPQRSRFLGSLYDSVQLLSKKEKKDD